MPQTLRRRQANTTHIAAAAFLSAEFVNTVNPALSIAALI
jgi:hypothetical protein